MKYSTATYTKIIVVLIIFIVVNLAFEAVYVYKTRNYVRNFYPALYANLTKPFSGRRGTNNNAGGSYFDQRVQAFTQLRETVPNKKIVIFVGDSLTDTFEWSEHFADVTATLVLNRGIVGDTVQGLWDRFDVTFLPKLRPKIFIMIGVNNISLKNVCEDDSDGQFLGRYYSLLGRLVQAGIPPQNIFVQSILPVFREDKSNEVIRTCNELIKQYSRSKGINYVDIYTSLADGNGRLDRRYSLDGLHLNSEGYRIWSQVIRPYVTN